MYKKINARWRAESEQKKMNDVTLTMIKGKEIRELAKQLTAGTFRIEKKSLNLYAVFEGKETPDQKPSMYLNRICFVRLDCEIYKILSRSNPLAFAIEKALDNDALTFCIDKALVDKMPVKLLYRTFSSAKVTLSSVTINAGGNYIITIELVKSVSERDLTQKELEIAEYFIKANTNASAGNPKTEMQALPAPETASAVDTTAKVIPEK